MAYSCSCVGYLSFHFLIPYLRDDFVTMSNANYSRSKSTGPTECDQTASTAVAVAEFLACCETLTVLYAALAVGKAAVALVARSLLYISSVLSLVETMQGRVKRTDSIQSVR